MAELVLKIGASTYEDGDILCAFNDRNIHATHAQHLCNVDHIGFTRDGLRPAGTLTEMLLQHTRQHKLERISRTEVRCTDLATLDSTIIVRPHIEATLARRIKHPRHIIFGAPGREIWYGERRTPTYSETTVNAVWTEIEAASEHRKADHGRWPAGRMDLRAHLFAAVDDMDDVEAISLVSEQYNEEEALDEDGRRVAITGLDDPKIEAMRLELIRLKRRKNKAVWRDLPGLSVGSQADIVNRETSVDIREAATFQRSQIVVEKSRSILEVG